MSARRDRASGALVVLVALALLSGCGEGDTPAPAAEASPYAQEVVSFSPGSGAGFGQEKLPGVVLGPPLGKGALGQSLDVLSLGVGGEIVLSFGDRAVVDGPGPDLLIFENPFWPNNDPALVFAEPGEVAVSEDGVSWHVFPCAAEPTEPGRWPGCAGWSPTRAFSPEEHVALTHEVAGGDAFDLATVGLERARFVRIRDLATEGMGPSAGFDLDAVAAIHHEPW